MTSIVSACHIPGKEPGAGLAESHRNIWEIGPVILTKDKEVKLGGEAVHPRAQVRGAPGIPAPHPLAVTGLPVRFSARSFPENGENLLLPRRAVPGLGCCPGTP